MKGIIVAINRHLGTLVVETDNKKCAVLATYGRIAADIGDIIEGDWVMETPFMVSNITRESQMQMTLQSDDISRYEAVGSVTVI